MTAWSVGALALAVGLAPALPGVATRVRSLLTGRRGPPVLQLYFDLARLLRKRPVYSATTTRVFRAAPLAGVVCGFGAALLVPFDGRAAVAAFPGDFLLLAGLLAVGRFLLILAALDTGSSFEGMGASRDAMVGAFAEAAFFLACAALVLATGRLTVSEMIGAPLAAAWPAAFAPLLMVGICLFILLLAESSRVPVDDPATHLELTMIHEVAVLDHSGPDLALVLAGTALRFVLFATLVAGVLAPRGALPPALAVVALPVALALVAGAVGAVESVRARFRLDRVHQFLVVASVLAVCAATLLLSRP